MAARKREWVIRATLATGVPLFLVAGIELGTRAAGVGYDPAFWIPVPSIPAAATNDAFGLRFFPPGLARTPAPEKVLTGKPANVRRVFLLGESAAMGFPEPALGLAPMLEHMLLEAQPGVKWQVHNAAMTAINSHVIRSIARDCARLSPDFFIILTGNNEAVGPFGPATVFGQSGAPVWVAGASSFVRSMRVGQILARVLQGDAPKEWRGLEMFVEQRINAGDPRLARMYDAFRHNLREIVRTGITAGAEVLMITVPVNLRDCPPFASDESGTALAEFRKAQELLASGRRREALDHFRSARDLDMLRFRADSRINGIVWEVAQTERVRLVDAEEAFGLTGNELFWEHVHFTPSGTYEVARLIANELGVTNPPNFSQVRSTMPVTAWDQRKLRSQIAELLLRPPFNKQPGAQERIAELRGAPVPSTNSESKIALEAAVARRPDDLSLLGRYATFLREAGEPKAAADVFARMSALLPGRKAWHVSRGAALSDAGLHDEAIKDLAAALQIDSQFDLAHFGLGLASARTGRHQDAVRHYSEALRLNPAYADAAYNLAGSLVALHRTNEAREHLERAIAARPDHARAHAALAQLSAKEGHIEEAIRHYTDSVQGSEVPPEAHYDLGVLLARQGRLDEAVTHYIRATQLRPEYPEALNNLGIALVRKGDRSAAAQAFERALAARPSFEAARANLNRVRGTSAPR